eukprot:TRINITY_DN38116_c0_g1_i1.p2 TRINITY_DN38116_c0_g1~~TRINITY_DN38116_c0_g1_i1.p2  ORF type:complete len:134 (+),score=54.07 TRINITY_DN38116_c0_g1_i1:90-491(+)
MEYSLVFAFFFSSRRRHTRCREVSWARRCVQETGYQRRVHGVNTIGDYAGSVAEISLERMNYLIDSLEEYPAALKAIVAHALLQQDHENEFVAIEQNTLRIKNLRRWPLFVHISGAILCLLCSSIFHLSLIHI